MIWKALRHSWLAPLLRQTYLCRALLLVALALGILQWMGLNLFPCHFAQTTGLPCPGCGITRATSCMLRGDWQASLQFHPLVGGFMVIGALMTFSSLAPNSWRERVISGVSAVERRTALPTLFLLAVLLFGFLRMAGVFPREGLVKPSPVRSWLLERQAQGGKEK